MRKGMVALGVIAGAGMMYLFDPARGRSRRARARDKAYGTINDLSKDVGHTVRNFGNRVEGLLAETAALLRHENVTDEVLVARIRTKLGRAVRHPHGVVVTAVDGHVRLSGVLPAEDISKAVKAARAVCGVTDLESDLQARPGEPTAGESRSAATT
jgi:hypothetical protein